MKNPNTSSRNFILAFLIVLSTHLLSFSQDAERQNAVVEFENQRVALLKIQERLLLVPETLKRKHSEFLSDQDTGIVRLLPRETYAEILPIRGGGAFYSFVKKTHEYGHGSDILLERGNLSVGFAGADYGYIHHVTAHSLEELSTKTPGIDLLAEHQTPNNEKQSREEQRRSLQSYDSNNFRYSRSTAAIVGEIYAIRSINFHRSDVLVVFKIIAKDQDGSLILLWKKLHEYPIPTLGK